MDINQFLNKVKIDIANKSYDFIHTGKNKISRRKYGLTMVDIEDYIANLNAVDLYEGPVVDRDYPNEKLYIFKKEILQDVVFYTKIKIKNNQVKILSCHEDEK